MLESTFVFINQAYPSNKYSWKHVYL